MKLGVVIGIVTSVMLFHQTDASSPHRRQKRGLAKLLMHIYYDPVRLIRYYHAYDQAREVLKSWRGIVPTVMLLPFTDRMPDTYGVTKFINPNPEPIRGAHSYGYSNYHYVKSPNSFETYIPVSKKQFFPYQKKHVTSTKHHKPDDSGMMFINDNIQRNAGLRKEHQKEEIKHVELPHANIQAAQVSSHGPINYNQATVAPQLPDGFHNFQPMPGPYNQNGPIIFGANGQGMVPLSQDHIIWQNNEPVNAQQTVTHMPAFAYQNNVPQMALPHQYPSGGEYIYFPNDQIQHSPQGAHIPTNMDYFGQHGVLPYTLPNEVPHETLSTHQLQTTQHQTNLGANANGLDENDWSYILSQTGDITYVPHQKTDGDSIIQNLGDLNSRHVHQNPKIHVATDDSSTSNETSDYNSVIDNSAEHENTNKMIINNTPFVWQRLETPNSESSESVKTKQIPSPEDQELALQNKAHHNHLQNLRAQLQHSKANALPSSEQNKSRVYQHHPPLALYHNSPPSKNKEEKIPNIEIIKPILLSEQDNNHKPNLPQILNSVNTLSNIEHIHTLSNHDVHLPKSASQEYRSVSENNFQQKSQNPVKLASPDSEHSEKIHSSQKNSQLILPINDQVLQSIKYRENEDDVVKSKIPLQGNLQIFQTKFENASQSTKNDDISINSHPPVNKNHTILVSSTVKPHWISKQVISAEAIPNTTTSTTTTTTTTMKSMEELSEPDSNQVSFKYYQNVKLLSDSQPVIWTKHESSSTTTSAPKFPENELELHMPRIRNATNPPRIYTSDNLHQKSSGIQVQAQPFYGTKVQYYPAYETSTKPSSPENDPQRLMLIMLKKKVA